MPYDSPYRARILELTSKLAGLQEAPAGPMFTDEEIAARQAKQAKEEQLAVLAKLSGDKPLQAVGATLLPEALKAAAPRYTEHGELQPLTGKHSVFPEYTRRTSEERLSRELGRAEASDAAAQTRFDMAEAQRKANQPLRDAQADLASTRRALLNKGREEGAPLKGKSLALMEEQGATIDTMISIGKKLSEEFSGVNASGIAGVGEFQDTMAIRFPFLASTQWKKNQRAWAELQRLAEMPARYKLFGATLTNNEMNSWQKVTPSRGWSDEQIKEWVAERMAIIQQAAKRNAEGLHLGGANASQLEHYSRGAWTAPKKSGAVLSSEERLELEALEKELGHGR